MTITVSDEFTISTAVELKNHVPTSVGAGWVEEVNSSGTTVQVRANSDDIATASSPNNVQIIYTALPDPANAEYDVECQIKGQPSSPDESFGLVGRYIDANNYYFLRRIKTGGEDLALYKKVGGVVTKLIGADVDPSPPFTLRLEIRNAAKKAYVNGVEVLSTTDNELAAIGKAGLGWGNLVVSGDDIASAWVIDNFILDVLGESQIDPEIQAALDAIKVRRDDHAARLSALAAATSSLQANSGEVQEFVVDRVGSPDETYQKV